MTSPMHSYSITVRMTPRQAVSAMRALELAGATTTDARAYTARHRLMVAMWDAGWTFDEADDECWRHPATESRIPDRVPE